MFQLTRGGKKIFKAAAQNEYWLSVTIVSYIAAGGGQQMWR